MPRRRIVPKRKILPDPKYHNETVAKFINHVMVSGKKSVAERIVYGALSRVAERDTADPVEVFESALQAVAPMVEVKSRRVGGATYQVPVEVRPSAAKPWPCAWLVESARARGEKSMALRLAGELMDASQGRGAAVKRREDTHRMAEANRAFSHYRY